MSVAAEVGLLFARETRRTLLSAKGLALGLLFLLGGTGALQLVSHDPLATAPPQVAEATRRGVLALLYPDAPTVEYLMRAPRGLLELYQLTLYFVPLIAILIGYDQIAGEIQHRTIRFTTLRAHRESIAIGKALAAWASMSMLSLALEVIASMVLVSRGESLDACVHYGLRFWLATTLFAGAYTGLTAFVSSMLRHPPTALFVAMTAAVAWRLVAPLVKHTALRSSVLWLAKIVPAEWDPMLLSPASGTVAQGAAVLLAMQAVFLAAAALVLRRRDV